MSSTPANVNTATGEVVESVPIPDDATLASLDSIGAVRDLMGPEATDASDLGSGFAILEDHDTLIGRPCMFLFWSFRPGDFGDDYVSAHVVTFDMADGKITGKYIVNDGSTGIREQLRGLNTQKNLLAKRGLRKSSYTYCEQCKTVVPKGDDHVKGHKLIPGATYYVDTTAVA